MGPQDDTGWFARNLQHLSDMVIVISPDTTVVWGNEAVERILGWSTEDFVGRSFAEFLHPDDLERAIEVASLVDQDVFVEDAVRPALYRVRTADDDWMTIELNSAVHPADDGLLVVMGRFTGDLVHSTRLLTAVTRGAPVHEQVAITLDLGRWRYPRHGYVVVYRVADGYAAIASDGVPIELTGPESSLGALPWRHAVAAGEPFEVVDHADGVDRRDVIPDEVLAAATDAGFVGVLALPVADDGYGEDAAIVVWSRRAGSALVGHRYAIESMVQALDLVLQQRAQRLKLEQAAYTDLLTGVPSRRRFLDLIDEADDRPGGDVGHAVLYIDIDHFKQVNDTHSDTPSATGCWPRPRAAWPPPFPPTRPSGAWAATSSGCCVPRAPTSPPPPPWPRISPRRSTNRSRTRRAGSSSAPRSGSTSGCPASARSRCSTWPTGPCWPPRATAATAAPPATPPDPPPRRPSSRPPGRRHRGGRRGATVTDENRFQSRWGSDMRVVVDFDLCESNAVCMGIAPEVFEVRDDDYLYVLQEEPAEELHERVREAASRCPKQAITLEG